MSIYKTVWTIPDPETEPDAEREIIGTVKVTEDEISLTVPGGQVLYRASLERWALQMVFTQGRMSDG